MDNLTEFISRRFRNSLSLIPVSRDLCPRNLDRVSYPDEAGGPIRSDPFLTGDPTSSVVTTGLLLTLGTGGCQDPRIPTRTGVTETPVDVGVSTEGRVSTSGPTGRTRGGRFLFGSRDGE